MTAYKSGGMQIVHKLVSVSIFIFLLARISSGYTWPSSINVCIGTPDDYGYYPLVTLDFETYCENVLPNEWATYWKAEALKAGAMVVKQYAYYYINHHYYKNKYYADDGTFADILDGQGDFLNTCQVYKENSSQTVTNNACDDTWFCEATQNSVIPLMQYNAGNSSSPNPTVAGNMSQNGSEILAERGYLFGDILNYYYGNCNYTDCTNPTPVLPNSCGITDPSGPTQFVYTGSNATFSSQFVCTGGAIGQPPSQWNWSLIFYHQSGSYQVFPTYTTNNSTAGSTWNIPNFVLPSTGYNWSYNSDGLIIGYIQVTGLIYTASTTVTYSPPILLPGNELFHDQPISSSHPDVKVHNSMLIYNEQISGNGSVNFKAGQSISILPETKILPGSNVKITIDPTLQ